MAKTATYAPSGLERMMSNYVSKVNDALVVPLQYYHAARDAIPVTERGFANGFMMGLDPLGVMYTSRYKAQTYGGTGAGDGYATSYKMDKKGMTSGVYQIPKYEGIAVGVVLQILTYGLPQLIMAIGNLKKNAKPVHRGRAKK